MLSDHFKGINLLFFFLYIPSCILRIPIHWEAKADLINCMLTLTPEYRKIIELLEPPVPQERSKDLNSNFINK